MMVTGNRSNRVTGRFLYIHIFVCVIITQTKNTLYGKSLVTSVTMFIKVL